MKVLLKRKEPDPLEVAEKGFYLKEIIIKMT